MKIKNNINLEILLEHGFQKLDDEYKQLNNLDYESVLYYEEGYIFNIGHSRRGQFYYIIIHNTKDISLIASKPDGSGGAVPYPTVLHKLSEIIEYE